jgi:hypothetical protein
VFGSSTPDLATTLIVVYLSCSSECLGDIVQCTAELNEFVFQMYTCIINIRIRIYDRWKERRARAETRATSCTCLALLSVFDTLLDVLLLLLLFDLVTSMLQIYDLDF